MSRRDVAAYCALALLWGVSFAVVLEVVEAFGWVGAVSFRALIASLVLVAIASATGRRLRFTTGPRPFVIVGATTVAGQLIGISVATPRIGTAMAAILVATIPLFSMVIGHLWGLERITAAGVLGLALGIAGVVLLVGFPAVPITGAFLVGCAFSLGGAFAAAFGSIYAKTRLQAIGTWELSAGAFLFGGLATLPLLVAVPVPAPPGLGDFAWLLVLGASMSALTYVLYFRLVADLGATKAISVEFAVTAVAVLFGGLALDEALSLVQLVGAAGVIAGCALILGLIRAPLPARA